VSWDQCFDRPVVLPDGTTLRTLEDARLHILSLPKSEHDTTAWQVAIEALLLAAGVSDAIEDHERRRKLGARQMTSAGYSCHQILTADSNSSAASMGRRISLGTSPKSRPPMKVPSIEPAAMTSRKSLFRPSTAKLSSIL
jgi:hypothetical protein